MIGKVPSDHFSSLSLEPLCLAEILSKKLHSLGKVKRNSCNDAMIAIHHKRTPDLQETNMIKHRQTSPQLSATPVNSAAVKCPGFPGAFLGEVGSELIRIIEFARIWKYIKKQFDSIWTGDLLVVFAL